MYDSLDRLLLEHHINADHYLTCLCGPDRVTSMENENVPLCINKILMITNLGLRRKDELRRRWLSHMRLITIPVQFS